MSFCVSYTVDGYEFVVIVGFGDGVLVKPETADFASAEWRAALASLCAAYPVIAETQHVLFYCDCYVRHADSQGLHRLYEGRQKIAAVRQRHDYSLLPDCDRASLDEYDAELARAIIDYRPPEKKKKPAQKMIGYVYLIQSPSGAYKIGRTKDPANRSKTFGVQLPFEVEFLALIATEDMIALESSLHAIYAEQRINGEWFALDAEDVAHIKSLTGGAA